MNTPSQNTPMDGVFCFRLQNEYILQQLRQKCLQYSVKFNSSNPVRLVLSKSWFVARIIPIPISIEMKIFFFLFSPEYWKKIIPYTILIQKYWSAHRCLRKKNDFSIGPINKDFSHQVLKKRCDKWYPLMCSMPFCLHHLTNILGWVSIRLYRAVPVLDFGNEKRYEKKWNYPFFLSST